MVVGWTKGRIVWTGALILAAAGEYHASCQAYSAFLENFRADYTAREKRLCNLTGRAVVAKETVEMDASLKKIRDMLRQRLPH